MTNNRNFKRTINRAAKAAKKNPTATTAIVAGGGIFAAIGAGFTALTAARAARKGTAAILGIIKDKKGAADPAPAADNTATDNTATDNTAPAADNAAPAANTDTTPTDNAAVKDGAAA